jgi:hypothetical protein
VSQLDDIDEQEVEDLEAHDRAWLEDRLDEYEQLLAYLHEH